MSIIAKRTRQKLTSKKKGDTLVEVAFAIGIFSLVAITVVSVISASTSAAQASLETTLTREDIDSQAEALRFIHDSYVNGIQSVKEHDNPYEDLWKAVTNLAYDDGDTYRNDYPEADLRGQSIKEYRVTTCSSLYNGNSGLQQLVSSAGNKNPFILNIRKLSSTNATDVVKTGIGSSGYLFQPATTYPRLMYSTNEALYSQVQSGDTLNRVEGLYIIAVKGPNTTVINNGTTPVSKPAYYDFYIRSCWMPTNSDRASTISTLVRLYDPTIIH